MLCPLIKCVVQSMHPTASVIFECFNYIKPPTAPPIKPGNPAAWHMRNQYERDTLQLPTSMPVQPRPGPATFRSCMATGTHATHTAVQDGRLQPLAHSHCVCALPPRLLLAATIDNAM